MKITGSLKKMIGELSDPIKYQLPIGDQLVDVNSLLGKNIRFNYENEIYCIWQTTHKF